ncbi:TPA: hypothetical protein ACXR0I_002945 [Klebsiella variicola subsp. variicola]|nr:hypothetical protein [Klebsiella variicola]EIX9042396.1 hypothetical protein [Klebsiella variicola]EIY5153318.1 hypothetical protein [Klebsiella variicola]MCB8424676.1 hypothetical protein [Klebsiella variicola subsp. variicola]MCB8445270.1 hypothetical protein [Klebsiella variicola subsp. variicola]VAN72850.1 Uncharacterised protein [Klebsiella variicola]
MSEWHLRFRLSENVVNSILNAIEKQRPSLFNYATKRLAKKNGACIKLPDPGNGAKKFTIIDPLIIGQNGSQKLLVEYCYQARNLKIDFSPLASGIVGDFRITANMSVGIGASDPLIDSDLLFPSDSQGEPVDNYIDYVDLKCFESNFEVVGIARFVQSQSRYMLILQLTKFTVGAQDGVYAMIEFYIRTTINAVILPQAAMFFAPLIIEAPDGNEPKIRFDLIPSNVQSSSFSNDTFELSFSII